MTSAPQSIHPIAEPSIVQRLRGTLLDKDNFPRMDSEKWLPVGLAKEAADRIELLEVSEANIILRQKHHIEERDAEIATLTARVEELEEALQWYADSNNYAVGELIVRGYLRPIMQDSGKKARAALTTGQPK